MQACNVNKLTPKQEGFCLSYIETGNASEAYRLNYNAEKMSEASIKVNACKLLKNTNITLTLSKLRKHHQRGKLKIANLKLNGRLSHIMPYYCR